MSPYERRRRSNVLRGGGTRLPDRGNADIGQRDSGHLAVSLSARRPDTEPAISRRMGGTRLWVNHGQRGVCEPALKPRETGKAHGRKAKVSNRTREIRPSGIIGGPRETWLWWNCEPTSQPKGQGW